MIYKAFESVTSLWYYRNSQMHTIYLIVSKESGKFYVGQTTLSLARRFRNHIHPSNETYIGNAIRKHGISTFDICKIDCSLSSKEANALERHYIQAFQAHVPHFGYNLTLGGDGGQIPNDATREKLSKICSQLVTPQQRIRMSVLGKSTKGVPRPVAVREKISRSKRRQKRPMPLHVREALAVANRKRKGMCTPAMWAHIRTRPAAKDRR
jgi:group I intron endonuclease